MTDPFITLDGLSRYGQHLVSEDNFRAIKWAIEEITILRKDLQQAKEAAMNANLRAERAERKLAICKEEFAKGEREAEA